MENPTPVTSVHQELTERHNYTRHIFQMLLQWFTVFSTINLAAISFVLKDLHQKDEGWLALGLAILFACQNLLGALACQDSRKWLHGERDRTNSLYKAVSNNGYEGSTPLPMPLYGRSIRSMTIALVMFFVAWVAIAVVAVPG